ncbi:sigma-70 family RNA polymerase sigma factor [Pedobacter sp. BS3]|uniref:RNA polymerase sigma factor n=1 Tax=Pedobacter sp. BS3 TaxID=2567937 RepID=UPI0011EC02C7|nr:sigma-70 family RNA polymerase sigma factor [Pedobacter sp. BS3]TZF83893.1 sigma-70 family RNA polymerase sigma factor [Pedobacter sp. BS3]
MNRPIKRSFPEDKGFILGILNNSKETLDELYRTYFPVILQFVLSNNGDEDDAKDIFQESVIVLYNKVKSGNFELSSKLKTFLYSVARRLWLKRLTHQSRNTSNISDFEEIIPVENDIEMHEERDIQFKKMEQALHQIGEPCKTILEDFYMNGRSMQEICERFGYTNADNAKNQKYKCLQRLKKLFFQGTNQIEYEK